MESIYGGRMSFYLEWTCCFFFSFSLCHLADLAQTETALFSFQVNTAVKFLQNPKVRQSPLATRKAFLKKKGERQKLCSSWKLFRMPGKLHQHHSVCVWWQKFGTQCHLWMGGGVGVGGAQGHTGLWGSKITAVAFCPGGLTGVDLASEYMIRAVNKWHTS